jgi:type IV secretory pathway VirB10-like protein
MSGLAQFFANQYQSFTGQPTDSEVRQEAVNQAAIAEATPPPPPPAPDAPPPPPPPPPIVPPPVAPPAPIIEPLPVAKAPDEGRVAARAADTIRKQLASRSGRGSTILSRFGLGSSRGAGNADDYTGGKLG